MSEAVRPMDHENTAKSDWRSLEDRLLGLLGYEITADHRDKQLIQELATNILQEYNITSFAEACRVVSLGLPKSRSANNAKGTEIYKLERPGSPEVSELAELMGKAWAKMHPSEELVHEAFEGAYKLSEEAVNTLLLLGVLHIYNCWTCLKNYSGLAGCLSIALWREGLLELAGQAVDTEGLLGLSPAEADELVAKFYTASEGQE